MDNSSLNRKNHDSMVLAGFFSLLLVFGFLIRTGNTQPNKSKVPKKLTPAESELVAIAEDTLRSEYELLVSGDTEESLKKHPKAKKASAKILEKNNKRLLKGKIRHEALKNQKILYTSYILSLDIKDLQVNNNNAILQVDANVRFPVSIDSKQLDQEYATVDKYIFNFALQNNQWSLVDSKKLDDNIDEDQAPAADTNLEVRPPASISPDQMQPTEPGEDKSNKNSLFKIYQKELFASSKPSVFPIKRLLDPPHINNINNVNLPKKINRLALVSINKQEIVNYAHVYSGVYDSHAKITRGLHPDWNYYGGVGGDCTNFVSQALYFGGWITAPGLWNTSFGWWAYSKSQCKSSPCQSYSWTAADYFYDFVKNNSARAYSASTFGELEPGDIIQVNYPPISGQPDYKMEHSMIVTHKNPKSTFGIAGYYELMVAYHSKDTLDKPFTDFYSGYPPSNGYQYYTWRIRTSY
jgi:hypothetical protein